MRTLESLRKYSALIELLNRNTHGFLLFALRRIIMRNRFAVSSRGVEIKTDKIDILPTPPDTRHFTGDLQRGQQQYVLDHHGNTHEPLHEEFRRFLRQRHMRNMDDLSPRRCKPRQ